MTSAAAQSNGLSAFPPPIRSYDVHIYYFQRNEQHVQAAKALREEIIEKFPELKVYNRDQPVGPHPTGMFEVDLKTPEQFLSFVPWIQVNRRGFSVLVHPNTGNEVKDHTTNAMWIGRKPMLDLSCLSGEDDSKYGL